MTVVRISRARFSSSEYEEVSGRLDASQESLVPAIQRLEGLVAYYAGVDPVSNTMVNVSVWASFDAADQMTRLPEMQTLAGEFQELGVEFERPVVNYDVLWQI
jgi:hypothetical protein